MMLTHSQGSQLHPIAGLVPASAADLLRIVIAGSDPLARAGLTSIAATFDDIAVLDEIDTEQISAKLQLLSPDVLLYDGGGSAAPQLAQFGTPSLLLVANTSHANDAIAAGARGVLARTASPRRLHAALRAVGEGLIVLDETPRATPIASRHDHDDLTEPLTAREQQVIELLASGLTNKEIAQRLGITEHTIKFHVNAILGKLGAETRTEAVVHAAKLGIVIL
jgi:two-component system nitrate/nitrite response regulator NarL